MQRTTGALCRRARRGGFHESLSGDLTVPGFYDGKGTWRVRFNPGEAGSWNVAVRSRPNDPELNGSGSFEVTPRETRGFLKATPGEAWGFRFESGEPAFLMGDTVYDVFGMDYCGGDIEGFLKRRVKQGFNLIRARLPMSQFHPPAARLQLAYSRHVGLGR